MEFKSNLTLSGYPAGTINGRLGVEWYDPADEPGQGSPMAGMFGKIGGFLSRQSQSPSPAKGAQPVARVQAKTAVKIDPIVEVAGLHR